MNSISNFYKQHPFLSILLAFQIFRLLLLPFFGPMPQDAYYTFYGEHLDWSYFDHPGMIGYLLRIFTTVFGKSVFVVKLTDFAVTSATLYAFYHLAGLFLSQQKQNLALGLMGSTFLVSVLSTISTPDVPLLLFWTLSLIALYHAVFRQQKLAWLLAGLLMGLAFDSKYTAVLLQFGLILFLIFSKKYRKNLISVWFWLGLLISVLVTFPVFYWNYQHDFASFLFQSKTRTSDISKFQLKPNLFLGTVGTQLFLLLPVAFCGLVLFSFKFIKKVLVRWTLPSDQILFLLCFFLPAFLGFFLISPVYWVKINWMMPGYITGIIFLAVFISQKSAKINIRIAAVLHLAFALEVIFYPVPIKSDDTWFGWKQLANQVQNLQKSYPDTFIFSADGYKTSAELSFFLPQKIYAQNVFRQPALQFDYVGDNLLLLRGKNALFIDSDPGFHDRLKSETTPPEIKNYFLKIKQLEPIFIKNGNREVRKFWVYYCERYQP
ncbi:MAG: glycosyltransferase family 39 protein [Sphingobacteriaceae bacterium]|nr:MAG: glycosyltransferase family 39 protein [Sphingobacteriaceae bacterium]